jgi:hypothetical protein
MTATATKTHRVFDVINGLYPVTFANVREADPAALLDIFEGSDSTRDCYLTEVCWTTIHKITNPRPPGDLWASYLSGFDTEHRDECYFSDSTMGCRCKEQQWADNQQWGTEVYEAIQQRIAELND